MKRLNWIAVSLLVGLLAACGGGGGNTGTNGSGGGGGGGGGGIVNTATVADFQVGFSKSALTNAAGDFVVLNVLALNASNNTVAGASVQVAVDSQAVFASSRGATDPSGTFSGNITTPVNKSNRIVQVSVTLGAVTKVLSLPIVGSQISITPVPGAPAVGEQTTFNISLRDAAGNAISSSGLSIDGSFGYVGSVNTSFAGDAVVVANAPTAGGTYTFTVVGSGITATRVINVIGAGSVVVVPPANTITNASLTANPTNIKQNLSTSTSNKSELKFQMVDPVTNFGIENVRVRFSLEAPLGGGESLSTGSGIVLTNSAGIASTSYISGLRTSPTNGVRIKACFAATDAALAGGACPNSRFATLTVAGEAVSLSIITDNLIESVIGNTLYRKTVVIQVADSAGNAVPGAAISASTDITHYGKAVSFNQLYNRAIVGSATATIVLTLPPNISDTYSSGTLGNIDTTDPVVLGRRVWCLNEDRNRNGVADSGEDIDGDGVLEPRASEVLIIPIGSGVTDAFGVAQFKVQWGQNVATWLSYTIKATASVSGSEGTNSKAFITDGAERDVSNGSFLTPPYGSNNCRTNN
jgi:hypothetical protein